METKKILAIGIVVVLIGAGIAYFALGSEEADADIIIACGTKNCYEPFWIADHYGYYGEEGVSVKMLYVDGGGNAMASILAGRADITLVGADPAIRFLDKTQGGMVIGTIFVNKQAAAYDFAALTKYNVDLDDPAGTLLNADGSVRVHCGLDTTTGYYGGYRGYLYSAYEAGKLTESQYNLLRSVKGEKDGGIVHVDFDKQVTALLQDEVQMLCSGNTLNIAKNQGGERVTTMGSPYEDPVGCCVLIASEKVLAEKHDKVLAALRAFDRACADIENPDKVEDVAKYCADFYNAEGWTVQSQKDFFNTQYWDICMMKNVDAWLDRKANLIDYEGFQSKDRIDYSFLEEMYSGKPYTYDPATGKLE